MPTVSSATTEEAASDLTSIGSATDLSAVESATVRIVAKGTFAEPGDGLRFNVAGSGSGFTIDPSGLAVTNHHVVTGGAVLEVHVAGEDEPRSAQVLGVSECADLAVIDIDGDDFGYLEWEESRPTTGLDVYAAGFPLGDPEFTLTRGIISKDDADGDTSWASVDAVVEHDAVINPGSSGGPLVTVDGKVVGINYAGNRLTGQSFAIPWAVAQPILDELADGNDVLSLGINGEVLHDPQSDVSGIWVSSVETGSPADAAGITAGDIVTRLEGLVLGSDGTLADYCDILRSHLPGEPLAVEVVRLATGQVLQGRLNGPPLEVSSSEGQVADGAVAPQSGIKSALGDLQIDLHVSPDPYFSGCSPGTPDTLPDGIWYGYIVGWTSTDLDFDLACYLGIVDDDDGTQELVRNENPNVRRLTLHGDAIAYPFNTATDGWIPAAAASLDPYVRAIPVTGPIPALILTERGQVRGVRIVVAG